MPVVVDLFSKAGGAAMGYWQAGFDVVCVDIEPQPNNPFEFFQHDALSLSPKWLRRNFDLITASPPCWGYSVTQKRSGRKHDLLIGRTRELCERAGLPYIIENVEGAAWDMRSPVTLCGSSFGLRVRRHRLFESNKNLESPGCNHSWQDELPCYEVYVGKSRIPSGYRESGVMPVFGGNHLRGGNSLFHKSVAMGIDWMTEEELNQAIPPAYTLHLGRQMKGLLWP